MYSQKKVRERVKPSNSPSPPPSITSLTLALYSQPQHSRRQHEQEGGKRGMSRGCEEGVRVGRVGEGRGQAGEGGGGGGGSVREWHGQCLD